MRRLHPSSTAGAPNEQSRFNASGTARLADPARPRAGQLAPHRRPEIPGSPARRQGAFQRGLWPWRGPCHGPSRCGPANLVNSHRSLADCVNFDLSGADHTRPMREVLSHRCPALLRVCRPRIAPPAGPTPMNHRGLTEIVYEGLACRRMQWRGSFVLTEAEMTVNAPPASKHYRRCAL